MPRHVAGLEEITAKELAKHGGVDVPALLGHHHFG